MAETDVLTYLVLNALGQVVGSVVHIDHTSINVPYRRTQSIVQRDTSGAGSLVRNGRSLLPSGA